MHRTNRACFGVTEPNSGLDTLKLQTRAVRNGDNYEISGQKMWISTAQASKNAKVPQYVADHRNYNR